MFICLKVIRSNSYTEKKYVFIFFNVTLSNALLKSTKHPYSSPFSFDSIFVLGCVELGVGQRRDYPV